ncbi:terpenoid synthase [Pholiota conissans]|uniref:Terpenoid synthase n=1 Tax=Pholiota conissans TaxID=109636 RepID=A0A9P5Z0V5_9AGAR|nr:terpenoid synthase [Pholiota conissans]
MTTSNSIMTVGTTVTPQSKEATAVAIQDLLQKIDTPYIITPYSQDFHNRCCAVALERGYPMGSDRTAPSLLPFIPSGVIMACTAYTHIEDEATRIFIALYTAFLVYVDDAYERDNERVCVFIERFLRREKQLDPVLDSMASFLLEIPVHYEPVAASIILTSTLNLINASTLEFQTKGMKASLYAKGYPEFTRKLSGSSETYALMAFPRSIPVRNYIQCIPEAVTFIGYGNDVLSFYKEDAAGETVNCISLLAGCQGQPKMDVFKQLANDVAEAHVQVCKILESDTEAFQAWQKFKDGYVGFHTSFDRYLLDDLMN